jgi:hypothetical protein
MTPRIVGIDSWAQTTEALLLSSAERMGQAASFKGSYFHGESNAAPEFNNATGEPVLAKYNVRDLPILRQTNRVGLGHREGRADGILNASDILDAFGEPYLRESCGNVRAFLDVEGEGLSHLSRDYWLGLCEGLISVSDIFWPCVYAPAWDRKTWDALDAAMDAGAPCYGAWLTAPYKGGWAKAHEPIQWTPSMLKAYPLGHRVKAMVWQYAFYGDFDANLVNPDEADATGFLRTLPLTRART